MKPVMYVFVNRGLGMSPGKLAAQVAHAAVEAYRLSSVTPEGFDPKGLVKTWYHQGHTKIVMLAEDTEQLHHIQQYLEQPPRGYLTHMVIDEGRTEVAAFTPTALGIELVDKDDSKVLEHFGHFKTYREARSEVSSVGDTNLWDRVRQSKRS